MVNQTKTPFWCALCQKEVEFRVPWYEKDLHMLRFHQKYILEQATKQYLKPTPPNV